LHPRFTVPWLAATLLLLAAGCGLDDPKGDHPDQDESAADVRPQSDAGNAGPGDAGTSPDAATVSDVGATDDLGTRPDISGGDAATDVGTSGPSIAISATSATLQTDFTADISGTMGQPLGDAELTDNVGYVEIDGAQLPTFGYRVQEWTELGLTLVQSLAVREDAIFPLWFYCTEGALDGVYFEGTEGTPSTWIPASSGTCDLSTAGSSGVVNLPALSFEPPAADHRFEVTGELTISAGEAGFYTAGDRTWETYGFETIDCTMCENPGWWELHALLWDPETHDLCFSIFYLYENGRDSGVAYTMCLPGVEDLVGDGVVAGDWSH
jgi:hypothetical protein